MDTIAAKALGTKVPLENIVIDLKLHRDIEKICEKEKRTISSLISLALKRYIIDIYPDGVK